MKKCIFIAFNFLLLAASLQAQDTIPKAVERQDSLTVADDHTGKPREVEPKPLNMQALADAIGYPPEALRRQIEGKVLVNFKMDKQGNYIRHRILQDPHPLLTKAVEKQISILKFTPAIMNWKPIDIWVTIPFNFALKPATGNDFTERSVDGQFYSLEEALACDDPSEVTSLMLHNQQLDHFPLEILRFKQLQRIELGANAITSIPADIAVLKRLQVLGLCGNKITELPAELWKMNSLKRVYVGGNNFSPSTQKSLAKAHRSQIYPHTMDGEVAW